ncbi:hypothetical protein KC19_1G206100 [Ceratodon purpureus]|uniref:Uncharacterized protein n=1 Tax=Ceratodon purpureus TaxID=3225 RepID=A0A8T0J8L0_CERPU|nr:hypothetical protein KC19_1G205800 [Ceratodon purpureus]KAG0591839.1 hypothetical protein KC19_1G206100 [Ceratodon purpureus]
MQTARDNYKQQLGELRLFSLQFSKVSTRESAHGRDFRCNVKGSCLRSSLLQGAGRTRRMRGSRM